MALWMDNSSVVKSGSSPNFDGAGSGIAFFETVADAGSTYDDDFESSFFNFKSKTEIYTPPHDSFESNLFDSFSALKQEQASATDDDTLFGESSFVSDLVNFVKVEPVDDSSPRSPSPDFPMFNLNDIDVDQQQHGNNPFDIDMKPLENMFISADDSSFNDFGNVSLEDFGLNNVKDDFNFSRTAISAEEEKLLNEFCLDYLFRNDVNVGSESTEDSAAASIKVKEEDDSAAVLDDAASRKAAPLISNYASVKEEPVVEDFDNDLDSFFDVNDQINWIPSTTAALPKATSDLVTINSNDNEEPLSDAASKHQDGCGSVLLSKVAGDSTISSAVARQQQQQQQNRHQKVTVVVNTNARSILAANGSGSSVGNKNGDGKSFQRVVICSKKPQHQLTAASGIKSVSGKIVIQKPQSDTTSEKTLYIPRQNGRKAPAGFVTVSVLSKEFGRQVLSVRNNSQKSEQPQSQKHVTVIPKKHCPPDEDLVRPETPQSLVGSDDENSVQLRSGPVKTVLKSFASRKYYNCEDDGLTGESYKCLPPAEVTGQFQPKMSVNGKNDTDLKLFNNHKLSPMIDCSDDLSLDDTTTSSNSSGSGGSIKTGPELLSDLDGNNPLVSFYHKTILTKDASSSPTKSMELLYNKNAASIDHDYGYSSSTNNNRLYRSSYRLNTDSLGIQTPSASEPPTDDSEDDSDGSSDRSQYNQISLKYRRCIDTLNGKRREIIKCMPASPKRSRKRRHSPSPDYDDFSNIYCKSDSSSSPEKLYPSAEGSNGGPPNKSNQKNHLISSSRIGNNGLRLRITTSTTAAMVNSMKAISDLNRMSSPNPLKRKYRKSAANCEGGSGGGSGSKSFTPIERMMHNTNEQVRRVEMRKAFEKLKQLIPNLREKVKAPKVHILQEAKLYCGELHYEELKFLSRIEALTQLQEKLRANLSRLRRSAAASRGCIVPA